jgi:hypothetical protein
MSKTPRTDVIANSPGDGSPWCNEAFLAIDLARELERENAMLREALRDLAADYYTSRSVWPDELKKLCFPERG